MSKIEELAGVYENHIRVPWQRTVAGAQRVIMVVYDKELERLFRARKQEFEQRTTRHKHGWMEIDCTRLFAEWMAKDEYRDAYFEQPEDLILKLQTEFMDFVSQQLRHVLDAADDNTVVAVMGIASLYGFVRVSDLVRMVEPDIKGRLVVFYPGSKDGNNYRLLDARDGWNYLAYAITLDGMGGSQ